MAKTEPSTRHFGFRASEFFRVSAFALRISTDGSPLQTPRRSRTRGFTLIELMVVIGIIAVVMAMGVPAIYRIWHKDAMAKALTEVQEVFSHARARSILQGVMTEVIVHPKEGRLDLASGSRPAETHAGIDSESSPPPPANAGLSAVISDRLTIEMLDINLTEYKDAEIARIRFYPNGMCDEVTLILRSDQNEWRKLSLEVTTGLATVGDLTR